MRAEHDLLARCGPLPASFDQVSVLTIAVPAKVLQDDDATVEKWLEHDLCFPPSRGREMAAAMAKGEFVEIEGVAHGNGPFDAAPHLGATVVAFLAAHRLESRLPVIPTPWWPS